MNVTADGSQFFVAEPFFSNGAQTDTITLDDGRVLALILNFELGENFQTTFLIDGVAIDPETGAREVVFSIEREDSVFLDSPKAEQLSDGRVAVIWGEPQETAISAPNDLKLQVFNADWSVSSSASTLIEGAFNSNAAQERYDITAQSDGGYAVTWLPFMGLEIPSQDRIERVMLSRFDNGGVQLGTDITINPTAPVREESPQVLSLLDGTLVVAWQDSGLDFGTLSFNPFRFQLLTSTGVALGPAMTIPDVTPSNTVLTILGVPELTPLSGGGFVVAWVEQSEENGTDIKNIYVQRYAADGTALGDVIEINEAVSSGTGQLSVTGLIGGGFVVAYVDVNTVGDDTSGTAINVTVLSPNGAIIDSDVLVNEVTVGDQVSPFVAATADGGFTVQWHDEEQFGDGKTLFARSFDVSSVSVTPTNGDDILTGTSGADFIDGLAGNDIINGGDGNDVIEGCTGNDSLFGEAGDDILRGSDGDDVLEGGLGDDTLNGGDGNDTIEGGDGDDRVFAGAGDDIIDGGAGNDLLEGKIGDDTIIGGAGNDILRGSDGSDMIEGGTGDDTAFGGNDEDTILGGAGNDTLDGSGGDDFIDGEDGDDILVGETGADIILGGNGNDTMRGGGGDDFMDGEDGDDLMFGSAGEDTMFGGAGNDTMEGNTQSDELFGESGNDILRGGDGFDMLDGGADDDILVGGNGNDTLIGGLGQDTLRGNGQNDTFTFNQVAESIFGFADLIDGIQGIGIAGGDVIDLSGIDADTTLAGNQAFTFLGVLTSASGIGFGAGGLWLEDVGLQTRLFGNVNGDGAIELAIRINDGAEIDASGYTAGDFIL